MGYSSLLDIIGSSFIGGMLLLILLKLNDASVKNNYMYGGELIVQRNLVEVVAILEHDFRKIGFCADWDKLPDPLEYIIEADRHSITFLTDVDADGNVDTLRYRTGDPSELLETPNPRDKYLYRILNNSNPNSANLGITEFNLTYFDAFNDTIPTPVASPTLIQMMQIDIKVEDVYGYDISGEGNEYANAFWRQIRMAARNLRNR